jgi:electron transport complex protein RnfB
MDILLAIAIMALGAVVLGAALGYASIKFKVEGDPLVEKIEAILPQTQCGQCSFPGCKPYAEAIAKGEADINLCPPGGMEGVQRLADLLGREVKPLDAEEKPKSVAIIDEQTCIGCTLCIQACPVDAIVGAAKQMHTIIAPLCTGCELCLPPCPSNASAWSRSARTSTTGSGAIPSLKSRLRRCRKPPDADEPVQVQGRRQAADQQDAVGQPADRRRPAAVAPRRTIAPEHRRHAAPGRPGRRQGA